MAGAVPGGVEHSMVYSCCLGGFQCDLGDRGHGEWSLGAGLRLGGLLVISLEGGSAGNGANRLGVRLEEHRSTSHVIPDGQVPVFCGTVRSFSNGGHQVVPRPLSGHTLAGT